MNFLGFTPSFFVELERRFPIFLAQNVENILKAEFFLPTVVNDLIREGKARVRVLPTGEKWFGITNPADREQARENIRALVEQGLYPTSLWA
jgi:hypothetical protein